MKPVDNAPCCGRGVRLGDTPGVCVCFFWLPTRRACGRWRRFASVRRWGWRGSSGQRWRMLYQQHPNLLRTLHLVVSGSLAWRLVFGTASSKDQVHANWFALERDAKETACWVRVFVASVFSSLSRSISCFMTCVESLVRLVICTTPATSVLL